MTTGLVGMNIKHKKIIVRKLKGEKLWLRNLKFTNV